MVTEKMIEAFWSKVEVTREGAIRGLKEGIEAALSTDAEPVAHPQFEARMRDAIRFTVRETLGFVNGEIVNELFTNVTAVINHCAPPAASVAVKAIAPVDVYKALSKFVEADTFDKDHVTAISRAVASALSAQVQDVAEYERREQVCKDAALSQWERSLKRPDLTEKDRVIGAVEAYKRQAFAFTMLPAAPAAKQGETE